MIEAFPSLSGQHLAGNDAARVSGGDRMGRLIAELLDDTLKAEIERKAYFDNLLRLQTELVRLQEWVAHEKLKLAVLFEGRDAAGKGGVIRRITQRLNPRTCRVVVLTPPDEREKGQWYFQRYIQHLPTAREIVLFDRSWYNRAGVERVLGFCTETECEEFLNSVPQFERMLARSGMVLVKYWFSITYEEQYLRLMRRARDPLKHWKLTEMDVLARERWDQYTAAKAVMFQRTHIPEAPWWVVDGVDKRRARLNCMQHLLSLVPYGNVDRDLPHLPAPRETIHHIRFPPGSVNSVPVVY